MLVRPVQNSIYFRGNSDDDKKRVSTGEVATVTGATGATGSAISSKFSQVNKTVNETTRNVKKGVEFATSTTTKARTTFGKVGQAFTHYRDKVLQYGQNATNSKILKPILTSKAFKGVAGFFGGAMAGFTAITGIGEMTNYVAHKSETMLQG